MSDLPEFKRLVCQLIGDGDLPDALQKLTGLLSNDTEKSIQAFHLKSRLSLLNREIDDGQLSHDERKRSFAELSKSLLSLVDRLESTDFTAKPATNSTNSTKILPAIPDLSGVKYDHCLRPEFTKLLARTLFEKRQSVNLVSPPETGSNRLVIDLENAPCRTPFFCTST